MVPRRRCGSSSRLRPRNDGPATSWPAQVEPLGTGDAIGVERPSPSATTTIRFHKKAVSVKYPCSPSYCLVRSKTVTMFPRALGVDVFVVRCMLRSDQVRRCNFIGGLQAIDGDWSRPFAIRTDGLHAVAADWVLQSCPSGLWVSSSSAHAPCSAVATSVWGEARRVSSRFAGARRSPRSPTGARGGRRVSAPWRRPPVSSPLCHPARRA